MQPIVTEIFSENHKKGDQETSSPATVPTTRSNMVHYYPTD